MIEVNQAYLSWEYLAQHFYVGDDDFASITKAEGAILRAGRFKLITPFEKRLKVYGTLIVVDFVRGRYLPLFKELMASGYRACGFLAIEQGVSVIT